MGRKLSVAGAIVLLLAMGSAFGQTFNGQIGGIVQDPSKALIPGVTITLTNTGTGVVATQVSNESGAYSFANVPPGSYRVAAALPGFKTTVFNDVGVGTAAQVRLDFTMQIGEVTSQVEVSVSAQQLLTESSATIGEVLAADRAVNLPIINQDVLELVRIMPGMRVDPFGDQFSTFTGLPTNTINTVRDGLSVTDSRNNSGIFGTTTINPDLVGEIRIILSPVDAEVGRGNGQIQIQTRSGTNRYTGSAVWNIRNTSVNAISWENNRSVNPLTGAWEPTRSDWRNAHQYTLSYGGPIIRNKTFFFALWDQNFSRTRTLVSNNVLTDTARQGIFRYFSGWNAGHFLTPVPTFPASATGGTHPVVDFAGNPVRPSRNPDGSPYTGELICFSVFGAVKTNGSAFTQADCPGGRAVTNAAPWDPFRATMDPTGYIAKLLDSMPHANFYAPTAATTAVDGLNLAQFRWLRGRSGNTGAQNGASPETVNRKQINLKIDHNINANNRVNAGWTYELDDNADNIASWPGGFNGDSRRRPHILTVNYNSTLSPSLVNEARFGISYNNSRLNPPWFSNDTAVREGAEAFLLQGGKTATGTTYPVAFTPGAGNYAFGNATINSGSTYSGFDSYLYSYADTVSWTRGAHAFRGGAELRLIRSSGFSGAVFPTASGGFGDNQSQLANVIATLPNQLATTRTNAANMLYLLAGSVNTASMLYWIDSDDDVKNGTWENYATQRDRLRKQIANEYAFFWKDDWKVTRNLTLNLGIRYEYFGSPYIEGGYTAAVTDLGYGLFGPARMQSPFDSWLQPGSLYLSGYGPNAGANALRCTTGTANPAGIPTSNCDPNRLTKIEFVGPDTDNPGKAAIPNDRNNFGPAVGFSWQLPWFGEGKTTVRGGFQMTYGLAGRNAGTLDTLLGNVPGNSSTAALVRTDFPQLQNNRALQLSDLPTIIPTRPTSPALPGGQIEVYNRNTNFTAYDPEFATPYTENYTLSATRQVTRNTTVEVKYIGVMGRKRQGTYNINLANIYYNKELFDALEMTRRGEDAPLFDQMFAGLDLHGATGTGYGPIGTTVNGVLQRGSAHLRRNVTFSGNLADGNYLGIANNLNTLNTATPATGAGALQALPAGLTGVGGRLLRNGCDRIAAGLYDPALPASATNIPTRCFAENYIVMNPQLGTPTYNANLAGSHYHSMQATMTARPIPGINFQTTYTYSTTTGYMPGNWNDPLNRNADKAPPYQAVKHDLRTNGTFELPIGPNKLLFSNSSGWVARLIERWQTSIILNASSGNPRTLIGSPTTYATGNQNLDAGQRRANVVSSEFDAAMRGHVVWNGANNNTGLYYGDRWLQIEDPQCQLTNKTDSMGFNLYSNGSCGLNAIAMKNPDGTVGTIVLQNSSPGKMGNAPFTLEAPGKWKFDANISKSFRLTESKSIQIRIDAENVMNHADVGDSQPITGQSISTDGIIFGQITSKGGNGSGASPRAFQAQVRFTF